VASTRDTPVHPRRREPGQADQVEGAGAGDRAGAEELIDGIDDLLDEIDAVLEEQAVLVDYRQRSGQ
jgi:Pup-like protein